MFLVHDGVHRSEHDCYFQYFQEKIATCVTEAEGGSSTNTADGSNVGDLNLRLWATRRSGEETAANGV
jgi:hypothetical protein